MPLNGLFGQIAQIIAQHSKEDTPGPSYDANPLLGAIQGAFQQHAQQDGNQFDPYPDYDDGTNFSQQYGRPDDSGIGNALGGALGGGALGGLAGLAGNILGGGNQQQQPNYNNQNIRPASEDPYGDPADQPQQGHFGQNVRPASEDPYGDPADYNR